MTTTFRISTAWFALACFAGAELGRFFDVPLSDSRSLPGLWPPAGVLVGALILGGAPAFRTLPFISVAVAVVAMLAHGRPPIAGTALVIIATADACLVAWIVRRVLDRSFTMHRVADILVLVVAAGLVPLFSGALASAILHTWGDTTWLAAWRGWWLAEALGILFVAPLATELIADRRGIVESFRGWRGVEFAVAYLGGVVM